MFFSLVQHERLPEVYLLITIRLFKTECIYYLILRIRTGVKINVVNLYHYYTLIILSHIKCAGCVLY